MKKLKKWIVTLAVLTVSCALIGCTDMLALRESGDTAFPDEIVLRARETDTIMDAEPEPYTVAEMQSVETETEIFPETIPETEFVPETESSDEATTTADSMAEPAHETISTPDTLFETMPESEPTTETTAAAGSDPIPYGTNETATEGTAAVSDGAGEENPSASKNQVTVPEAQEEGENLVWVPVNGGTKYHKSAACSKMKEPMQVTRDTAIANGYEPCKRCYGK